MIYMMKRLLIIGGSSFLGSNLVAMANRDWQVFFTYNSRRINETDFPLAVHLDIADREEVKKVIYRISPEIIIHTSAITGFNYAAQHKDEAWRINVAGTGEVVYAAEQVKARVVYISTDLVFNGLKAFCSEESIPGPVCYYGKTKLEAEKLVAGISSNYCIARMSLNYGWSFYGTNFAEILIANLNKRKSSKVFYDEYRTPVYVKNACEIILELAQNELLQDIYHICGTERVSRFEFGLKICEVFNFNKTLLIPTTVEDMMFNDERPKDCSLVSSRVMGELKARPCTIEDGLRDMLKSCKHYQ